MSSLRGSRAVSNLQVETIRFSNAALPAGATGSVFALDENGFMSLTSDIVASTLTVGGTVSITGTLDVGSLAVQELLDVSSAVVQNLRVSNSITLPPSVVIPVGVTSVEALYVFAGVTNVPINGDYLKYALDVSGATILRGPLTTLGTVSSRSIYVEGATAELVLRAGTTVDGRIRGTGSQLLVGSDSAIALGSQSGATVAMTVQPNARLVSIASGTTLNVSAIGGAGLQIGAPLTVAAASNFTAAPTFSAPATFNAVSTYNAAASFNAAATANAMLTIASGATLDVVGTIMNTAPGGNVSVNDHLAVYGKIKPYSSIEAQSQPLVLTATGGFGVSVAGNLQTTGLASVGGTLTAPVGLFQGRVGVGNATPAYPLDVAGAAHISQGLTVSGTLTAPVGIFQGSVGVGTATPAYPLDVSGSMQITGAVRLGPNAEITQARGGESARICLTDDSNLLFIQSTAGVKFTTVGSNAGTTVSVIGTLGVNTDTPVYTLDVAGCARISQGLTVDGEIVSGGGVLVADGAGDYVAINPFGGVNMNGNLDVHPSGSATTSTPVHALKSAGNSYINGMGDGYLGVGTTTPAYTLDVAGSAHISQGLTVDGTLSAANLSLQSLVLPGGLTAASAAITGELTAAGLTITNNAYITNYLGVGTVPNASENLAVGGNAYITDRLGVGTTPSSSYYLNVSGGAYISGGMQVAGTLIASLSNQVGTETVTWYAPNGGGFQTGTGYYFQIGQLLVRWFDSGSVGVDGGNRTDNTPMIQWDGTQFANSSYGCSFVSNGGSSLISLLGAGTYGLSINNIGGDAIRYTLVGQAS